MGWFSEHAPQEYTRFEMPLHREIRVTNVEETLRLRNTRPTKCPYSVKFAQRMSMKRECRRNV